jgi:hypothetical protein
VIDGQVVMEDHKVLSISETDVMQRSIESRQDLIKISGQETRDLLAAPWPKSGPYWRSVAQKDNKNPSA